MAPWWLAWLVLGAAGCVWLAQQRLQQLHDSFDTDARIAHRVLSQRMVQHEAILATLVLLQPESRATEPAPWSALTRPYPQVREVLRHPVTIPEGWDIEETARHLAAKGFGSESAFRRAMDDPTPIRDLDPRASSLEGYLFPETYFFERGASEAAIVAAMVQAFRDRYREHLEPLRPWPSELRDLRALVALASLVEKESSAAAERTLVAGVYTRRLRIGMLLQADPTTIYAKKLRGTWNGNLTREDLRLDDPYNTYRSPGLPPGPICSPGLEALVAAARPRDDGYLYFVSRNDGTHVFAATLAEHNANVLEWQKRYWQRRWGSRSGPAGPPD